MALIERWSAKDSDMGMAFKVTGPISLGQLDSEISTNHGWDGAALVVEGDLDKASPQSPAMLFVGHAGVDPEKVKAAGRGHEPDPEWKPPVRDESEFFAAVVAKAKAGGWLTEDEVQVGVRGLLSRFGGS